MTVTKLVAPFVMMFALGCISGIGYVAWRNSQQHPDTWPVQVSDDGNQTVARESLSLFDWLPHSSPPRSEWPASQLGKNHDLIKQAFTEITQDVSKSTVRLFCHDRQVALGTVIDAQAGHFITKASQLQGEIECHYRGKRRQAAILGTLPEHDLALLQVSGLKLAQIPREPGDSQLEMGSLLASVGPGKHPLAIGVIGVPTLSVPRERGFLGVVLEQTRQGPKIVDVRLGSSAATAGILAGDIVQSFDAQQVHMREDLMRMIGDHWPGDAVEFELLRDEKTTKAQVVLGRESDLDLQNRDFYNELGGALSRRRSGFDSVIQHDTVLLPEQCGGPVVDVSGRIVGINIARAERVASYSLPMPLVWSAVDSLRSNANSTGKSSRVSVR